MQGPKKKQNTLRQLTANTNSLSQSTKPNDIRIIHNGGRAEKFGR